MRCAFFLPVLLLASAAQAVDLTAGPMVGHVTDRSVRLWMQFPIAGEVTVNAFDVEHNRLISGLKVGLEGPTPFVCDVPINNLQPNSTYRVEVKFDGDPVKLPGPELVLRTAPVPGEEATFSVACGSGILVAPEPAASVAATQVAPELTPQALPIFRAITDSKPRAFFFLGNTGILPAKLDEFPITHRAAFRYLTDFQSLMRRQPDLQLLLRTTPCYAVLGERDFGPAGCDASYVFAPEALLAFQRFWPNPDWGTPKDPGCYSTCSFGDVDFFLLDTRSFRTETALLGAAQLAWLEKNLKASHAAFKILGAACTLWADDPQNPDADSWSRFPAEQHGFLSWLADNHISGLVAVAGNQAAGQLTRLDPSPAPAGASAAPATGAAAAPTGYPLFTLGVSTLAGLRPPAESPPATRPYRVGNPVPGDTFGTLDFTGQREHRTLTLRLRDAAGKIRLEQVLLSSQLRR